MSLEQVVVLPHPPIALPEVAGPRFNDVKKTAEGMIQLCEDIMAIGPETVIIITPHSTIHPSSFAVYSDETIMGNFAMFGAPDVTLSVQNNLNFIQAVQYIRQESGKNDVIPIRRATPIDHGSGVPLYYLTKAGYKGTVVIFNYCYSSTAVHQEFGQTIAKVIEKVNTKAVLIASGDLSHKIMPSAPGGFHPDGKKFDQVIVDAVESGNYNDIISMNSVLRANAGECAYNSLMVAFGALNNEKMNNKVYSYEAPFGVGYLVASL